MKNSSSTLKGKTMSTIDNNSIKLPQINNSQINKSNVTLWKSKYNQSSGSNEEETKVENNYIENLRKQVYFMEMELKLLKEREKEIEKSGGFTQLFNDDRDPSQHILQLKNKYASMRKLMENKIEQLVEKKRLVTGDNVSLKAKYEVITKHEKDVYDKLTILDDLSGQKIHTLENDYIIKHKERNEIEALNRAANQEIKDSINTNKQLEYDLTNTSKIEEMKQKDIEKGLELREKLNKVKQDEYLEVDLRIKALNNISSDDPIVKVEYEKNIEYKKKIEATEKELIMCNFRVDELEMNCEFLLKKKEEMIAERKKFVSLNEELRREIEQKSQLNEMRIQKKVKENNSEEIIKLEGDLKNFITNGDEFEKKILIEYEKSKHFSSEIIKTNIEIKHREAKREKAIEVVEDKFKIIDDLKERLETLKEEHFEINDKFSKATTQHEMLKNRNKLLNEEHSSITSKLNFVASTYDTHSNLKKISMDDMKILTQTNNMVNDSINVFVNKVGTFKSNNIPKSIFD